MQSLDTIHEYLARHAMRSVPGSSLRTRPSMVPMKLRPRCFPGWYRFHIQPKPSQLWRPAAIAVGVSIQPSQRFGLHNLRHSLSTFLVNTAKVQRKRCRASCAIRGSKRPSISTRRETAMKHGPRKGSS